VKGVGAKGGGCNQRTNCGQCCDELLEGTLVGCKGANPVLWWAASLKSRPRLTF